MDESTLLDSSAIMRKYSGYNKSSRDVINALGRIAGISKELKTADEVTRGRIALPLMHGGQGPTNPSHIADQALVANWAACALFLAKTAHALQDITKKIPGLRRSGRNTDSLYRRGSPQGGGPCHGHTQPTRKKIRSLGDEEQKILVVTFLTPLTKIFQTRGSNAHYHTRNTIADMIDSSRTRAPRYRPPCTPS